MTTLKEKLANGKFNGRIYANNTIYISNEKIENVDLSEFLKAHASIFRDALNSDKQKSNYDELFACIDLTNVTEKNFEAKRREVAISFNWAKEWRGDKHETLAELFENKIKRS